VPYSIGNVGPGFDRFGLCLASPFDLLDVVPSDRFRFEVDGDASVPRDAAQNVAAIAFRARWGTGEDAPPVRLRLRKGFRGGSGLGSSGASAVAGAIAAALLQGDALDSPDSVLRVVESAAIGEAFAAGAPHVDNALASLVGGFVLIESRTPLSAVGLTPHLSAQLVLAVPDLSVPTRAARAVLPSAVPREDAVETVGHAAALLHALLSGDAPRVGAHLTDHLAQPYRVPLVPGFAEARRLGVAAGAYGVALSGSGPAVFAIAPTGTARRVAVALLEGFKRSGVLAESFVTGVGEGARLSLLPATGSEA
jgi:homoserine kinase